MPIRRIDYAAVAIEPTTSFSVADARFCTSETDPSKIRAYTGFNTVTYASPGVSDADQKAVARYAEASASYIKTKLGLSAQMQGFSADGMISVCADSRQGAGNGGAGDRFILVSPSNANDDLRVDQPGDSVKQLVLHELIHVSHVSLSGCRNQGVNFLPKWFSEGAALFLAGQDYYHADEMEAIRRAGNAENPYSWIANGYPNFARYPAYRLAVEALVKDSGKTEDDLWAFTKSYFEANPCSNGDTKFNPAISQSFGNLLSDPIYVGKFWTETLAKYVTVE